MTFSTERNVEIRHLDLSVTGTDLDTTTEAYYTDFKLVELDEEGNIVQTLMGPQELAYNDGSNDQDLDFTDTWTMDAGESIIVAFTCDVANEATIADDTITVSLDAVDTSAGIKDTDTNEYITDIVPSAAVGGNAMTVKAATVTTALASTPVSDTIVKGSEVNLATFALTTGTAMDVNASEIVVTGYIDANVDNTYAAGEESSVLIKNVVTSLWLEDADGTQIGSTESFSSAGLATFSSLNWDLEAGSTELLYIYGNVSTSAPFGGTNDAVYVDLADSTSTMTLTDEEGNSVTATGLAANDADGTVTNAPTVAMTIADSGTLSVVENTATSISNQIVATGEEDVLVGRLKFSAADEAWTVNDVTLTADGKEAGVAADPADVVDNIYSVKVKYPTSADAPSTLDGEETMVMSSTYVTFQDLGMAVPKDGDANMEIYITVNDHALEGSGPADSDDQLWMILLTKDADSNGEFEAQGVSSNEVVSETSVADVTATNVTYVYRTIPTLANAGSLSLVPGEDSEIYRFSVTAHENEDVVLQFVTLDISAVGLYTGGNAGNSLSNSADTAVTSLYICNDPGNYTYSTVPLFIKEYGEDSVIGTGCYVDGNGTARFWLRSDDGATTSGLIVGANNTKTLSVYADVYDSDGSTANESLSVRVKPDTSYLGYKTVAGYVHDAYMSSVENDDTSTGLVWSDYGVQSGTHGETRAEWLNGYKVPGMPVSYVTIS